MIYELLKETDPLLNKRMDIFNLVNPPMDPNELEETLIENMNYYNGVGLSSNQIGLPYKVFTMLHEGQPITLFNPRIVDESDEYVPEVEGCLSYPGLFVKVMRPKSVTVQYYDKNKEQFQGFFSELSARIILHEMDHMMGNTFYDMASNFHLSQARKKRKINLRKMKKENHVLLKKV